MPPQPLSAFSLKALDDEYLTGSSRVPISSTKTSALRKAQHADPQSVTQSHQSLKGTQYKTQKRHTAQSVYDDGIAPTFVPLTTSLSKVLQLRAPSADASSGKIKAVAKRALNVPESLPPRDTLKQGIQQNSKSILKKIPTENNMSSSLSKGQNLDPKPQLTNLVKDKSRRMSIDSDGTSVATELVTGNESFYFSPPEDDSHNPPVSASIPTKNILLTPSTLAAANLLNAPENVGPLQSNETTNARPRSPASELARHSAVAKRPIPNELAKHFHSLEEYLGEGVIDRLTSPRKINTRIADKSVHAYKEQKSLLHPFAPTLSPKSIEMHTHPSPRMELATQRRKYTMLSSPVTNKLKRSNSTVSSVWGADSEIVAGFNAIKPPSEFGGQIDKVNPIIYHSKSKADEPKYPRLV